MHPIIAKIGPITIYSYGFMVAIAFLCGVFLAKSEAKRKNMDSDIIYDLGLYLLAGSLIGGRLYYIIFSDPAMFINESFSVFKLWQGGLAIHGAIFGGIISGMVFCARRKMSFWELADIVAPSLIIGQAIGRIGCFLNGCCYGVPTESVFGVRFPTDSLISNVSVHPTQLYEFALNLVGFFILLSFRKKIQFKGGLFLLYLMLYSCIRIIVSSFRGDSLYLWGTEIKMAQLVSVAIFLFALTFFIRRQK